METVVEEILRKFLEEDIGFGDLTTDALIEPDLSAKGYVVCKETAVIAGLEEAEILLRLVGCKMKKIVRDGDRVKAGTKILYAEGIAANLLKVERVLLNLLTHMSGVATMTRDLVDTSEGSGVRIACTRKTLPGLRYFEKKAVQLGGGDMHRMRLDDMVLIKDNHLALAGSIGKAIEKTRSKISFTKKIEVEVTKPDEAVEAATAGADIILLDNMKPEVIEKTVKMLEAKNLRKRVILEGSGGINKENISGYLRAGVDVISVGRITSSAQGVDMSFEIAG